MDNLKLLVDGKNIFGWKEISIRRSMESLCAAFSVTLRYENTPEVDAIVPEKPVSVLIVDSETNTETLVLTGYVDTRPRKLTANQNTLSITGRDKTQDLVDCSAIVKSNTILQSTIGQIARLLSKPFNINVVDEAKNTTKFKKVTIQSGESGFSILERLCRQIGIIPQTDEKSQLILANTGRKAEKSGVDLIYGENVEEVEEFFDTTERHSDYIVKGQGGSNGTPWLKNNATGINAKAKDKYVSRYRPLVLMAESKATPAKAKTRANWEAQVRSGRSKYYQVLLQGWRKNKDNPEIWQRNTLTNLIVDKWGINDEFLITNVEQTEGDKVNTTILTLKNPDTYASNPSGGLNV